MTKCLSQCSNFTQLQFQPDKPYRLYVEGAVTLHSVPGGTLGSMGVTISAYTNDTIAYVYAEPCSKGIGGPHWQEVRTLPT